MFYGLAFFLIEHAQKQLENNYVNECKNEDLLNMFTCKSLLEKYEDSTLKKLGRLNNILNKESIIMMVSKIKMFPVVKADDESGDNGENEEPEPPKRPPDMKYEDLPIYDSPHSDYKDYIADLQKCPHSDVKLLHEFVLPYVRYNRCTFHHNLCELRCAIEKQHHNVEYEAVKLKREFIKTMRDPNKMLMRRGIVTTGGIVGYMIGCGGGIPQRLICTSLGLLSTGALCFPDETEEVFRNFAYHVGKTAVAFYNKLCCQKVVFPERIPCERDMPDTTEKKYYCPLPPE